MIRKLTDYNGLHQLIGNAIMTFMRFKPQPFGAQLSKKDIQNIPQHKRAYVFMFLLRHLLHMPSNRMWSKFTLQDYKINYRAVKRYLEFDEQIMEATPMYIALPDETTRARLAMRKKSKTLLSSSPTDTESSPHKRSCVMNDSTTDDDDE